MDRLWRIELLGCLRARRGERVITRFRSRNYGLLLAYLAYYCHRSHPREALIDLLWPEADPDAGRLNLRVALSWLRRQMEAPISDALSGTILITDRETVRLNPEFFTTDVVEFETSLGAAVRAADGQRVASLTRAVELYSGDLMPGYDLEWVLRERMPLAESFLQAVEDLATECDRMGDRTGALRWARQAVAADPLREEAHRVLIRLLGAYGRNDAAVRQYRELERLLHAELGAEPRADTCELVRELTTAEEARPSAAHADPVGNLPRQLTRFFGREREIVELIALLESPGGCLVTLTGPGGSGKTRLALEVGVRFREPSTSAVWFVSLADLSDATRIADAVRDAMRLPRAPGTDALEQVTAFLSRQPALLMLDGLERRLPEGAAWVQRLQERVSALACLATSRRRLDLPGEREFSVLPLPVPPAAGVPGRDLGPPGYRGPSSSARGSRRMPEDDAPARGTRHPTPGTLLAVPSVQLFVDRVQAVRPDFRVTPDNAAVVAAVCRRLDGLPLALELAAARALVLTPAQMLDRMEDRYGFLVRRGHRHAVRDLSTASDRHQTLWAAIDWSYRLLSRELQRFFECLSVFCGVWTLNAAETVCAAPRALEFLEELRETSLVLVEEHGSEMRFRMLDTLREFGRERLPAESRAILERQHAEYYLALAEAAEPHLTSGERAGWLDRLEAERENLGAALDWSGTTADGDEVGVRLAGALGWFWFFHSHLDEGRRWLDKIVARTEKAPPHVISRCTSAWARFFYSAGLLAWEQGDLSAARARFEQSMEIARGTGDRRVLAYAQSWLGRVLRNQGNPEAGRVLTAESVEIFRESGDTWGLALSLNGLALCEEAGRSHTLSLESLALYRGMDDVWGVALALNGLAELARHRGEYRSARALYEKGLEVRQGVGHRFGVAFTLRALASLARQAGDDRMALTRYRESVEVYWEIGNRDGIARCLAGLARMVGARGQYERAARLLGAAALHSPTLVDPEYAEVVPAARGVLGEERFSAAWTIGGAMTLEQTLADVAENRIFPMASGA